MPWVLGHGTWPFGEEWLWEAIATSYLPVLDLMDSGAPLTLSMTPVLLDQLEVEEARSRCIEFLEVLRSETHGLDAAELRSQGREQEAIAVEYSAGRYEWASDRFHELGGDLVAAFEQHVSWTSAATHEVLPLAAVDGAIRMQAETGIASHRRRFGGFNGGFWLPECAHAPWLDRTLAECGVRASVVDWTDVLGLGRPENLKPHRSAEGNLLMPLDRELVDLVWAGDGYPAAAEYRNHHGLTTHHHRAWSNDGQPYDPERAKQAATRDATAFVAAVSARLAEAGARVRDPLAVVALDTELFGHWWHEGPEWLAEVVRVASERDLLIEPLDAALERRPATKAPTDLPSTSWGRERTLETWSGPKVADFAWRIRRAEIAMRTAGRGVAGASSLRALLALEASDWAFLADGGNTGDYPEQRAGGHAAALIAAVGSSDVDRLEGLAPDLSQSALFAP
jgi:1,4-alpha-glucan branching enzyme